jgi:hypothetical protein
MSFFAAISPPAAKLAAMFMSRRTISGHRCHSIAARCGLCWRPSPPALCTVRRNLQEDLPMQFRKHVDSNVWHSDHLCAQWPLMNFEESERPTLGKRCEECKRFDHIERHRRREDHDSRGSWE